ncbi:transketolase [Parasphaerochaeta coccoides]|uniref:Transketolase subunit A n=1 Tax=Parasphaerochaeta coccoides (strain ATCC BAA-1237 / DSM 17374 / SPN1) TaxID=760011 RepID=F4GJT8_PARC1|nr:transketolase [Parasphaerochaeta coccoides]AEC01363.1 transketolase subunit A [Parasphaerochaeta coccoides DSM 17374]
MTRLDDAAVKALTDKALELREMTIREIAALGNGHIGGSMSIMELLTYLYYHEMNNLDSKNPNRWDRDRLVCSKGHAGPAVYAVLASKGYFPVEWLETLNKGGTNLPSHCDMNKTPGIDFTTGSLGQGASAAVGIALGQKIQQLDGSYTYLIVGDGESQEGQVWEAAETAAQWKLGNLIAFTDFNRQQLDGYCEDIVSMNNIDTRWLGFNWHVQRINGHDFQQIAQAIAKAKEVTDRPSMIIMDTIKSQGYAPGVGIQSNHSMTVSKEDAEKAIKLLKAGYKGAQA